MIHTSARKIAGCLLLALLVLIAAGCSQAAPKIFTQAELKQTSDIHSILSQFGQVRGEFKYYSLEGTLDYAAAKTIVKADNDWKMNIYMEYDGKSYAHVDGNIYDYRSKDGSYCVYLFQDEEMFKREYVPNITKNILDANYDVGELVSVSTEGDTQTYVFHEQNDPYTEEVFGVTGAILETVHYTDVGTGLLRKADNYMILDGERYLLIEGDITYGDDTNFTVPAYVARCMDMSETRSITYILPDETTYAYTIPKSALDRFVTEKEYDVFTDPQYETPYTEPENDTFPYDFPAEMILYLQEKSI